MTVEIAGTKTSADWDVLRPRLMSEPFDEEAWNQAKEFLDLRLEHRYFKPIDAIRSYGNANKLKGEGFAICTLLCSVIEAIETFYEGINFALKPQNKFEYGFGESRIIYTNFLTQRAPFSEYFDAELATDFYSNVRCSLLHEACTRNGWKINIREHNTITITKEIKTINRSLFVADLKKCITTYEESLLKDSDLREAFVRKFDGICKNSK